MDNKEDLQGASRKIVPFEREVGYYLNKGNQHLFKNNWPKALLFFKKSIEMAPKDPLNHYNLGCLLSRMGQLKEANRIFEYILEKLDDTYWECYFFLAVNYGILEDVEEARTCLQVYLNNAPEGEMMDEAEELLWAISHEEVDYYSTPEDFDDIYFNENKERFVSDIKEMGKEDFIKKYENDSFFRHFMSRILYQGNDSLKEDVIDIYGHMSHWEAVKTLKEFVRNPWVSDRLKQMALLKFKNKGTQRKCNVFLRGKVQEVDLKNYPLQAPFWKEEWHQVLSCTLKKMHKSNDYDDNFFGDVQAMWIDYINKVYPDVPRFRVTETWAAGLEYSLVRFHFLGITQREIADKYGVSVSSVGAKFKAINDVLRIDKKAYRNMLFYLIQAEKGK